MSIYEKLKKKASTLRYRSPTATKQTLWKIDANQLRLGDILLERGSKLRSHIISWADRGKYSHALIWVGGNFIEAVGTGARVISVARLIIENPNNWLLLRLMDKPTVAQSAAVKARQLAHKRYDTIGAISTKLPVRQSPKAERLFCSQLIADAYQQAGIDLVDQTPPHKITPNRLLKSRHLKKISTPLIKVIDPTELAQLSSFIDRDKAFEDTSMLQEMNASQAAFDAVRPLISSLRLPNGKHPGNLSELLDCLQQSTAPACNAIADTLLTELSNREYFNFLREPMINTLLDMKPHQESRSVHKNVALFYKHLIPEWQDTAKRHEQNSLVCMSVYQKTQHDLWLRLAAMYQHNLESFNLIIDTAQSIVNKNEIPP